MAWTTVMPVRVRRVALLLATAVFLPLGACSDGEKSAADELCDDSLDAMLLLNEGQGFEAAQRLDQWNDEENNERYFEVEEPIFSASLDAVVESAAVTFGYINVESIEGLIAYGNKVLVLSEACAGSGR